MKSLPTHGVVAAVSVLFFGPPGRDRYCIDKNYGGTLIIWDRMFGTFEAERCRPAYGLTHPVNTFDPWTLQARHCCFRNTQNKPYGKKKSFLKTFEGRYLRNTSAQPAHSSVHNDIIAAPIWSTQLQKLGHTYEIIVRHPVGSWAALVLSGQCTRNITLNTLDWARCYSCRKCV